MLVGEEKCKELCIFMSYAYAIAPFNMLTKDFCTFLEYKISNALTKAQEKEIRKYWCDGILSPKEQLNSIEKVKGTKRIETKAYMPKGEYKDPNYIFDMVIWLGDNSLEKYLQRENLNSCVPKAAPEEWIVLDEVKRVIEVALL